MPALDTIYTSNVASDAALDIQWKLLAFIMSLEDDVISAIKAVPSEFQVICTALYAMVKVSLISKNSRLHDLLVIYDLFRWIHRVDSHQLMKPTVFSSPNTWFEMIIHRTLFEILSIQQIWTKIMFVSRMFTTTWCRKFDKISPSLVYIQAFR